MKPQLIVTEAGERLVVMTERDYDDLLARAGEEDAEDRMTVRLVEEARRWGDLDENTLVPSGAEGRPLKAL